MAFCTFLAEAPEPRTKFESKPVAAEEVCADAPVSAFEQAVTNILIQFPDAYHAVVEEMRRLDAEEKGKRSP